MDLATITMDHTEARKAFLEYRRSVKERHDEEDAAIMRGYRELANGKQLIQLTDTIIAGGTIIRPRRDWQGNVIGDRQLPALAVARADTHDVYVETDRGVCSFVPFQYYRGRKERVTVRSDAFAGFTWIDDYHAMVPIVPPALRPARHLRNYRVLFEADWQQDNPPAPRDPALLQHIGGDLYAVVAIWDLTELERAVLSGRRA